MRRCGGLFGPAWRTGKWPWRRKGYESLREIQSVLFGPCDDEWKEERKEKEKKKRETEDSEKEDELCVYIYRHTYRHIRIDPYTYTYTYTYI